MTENFTQGEWEIESYEICSEYGNVTHLKFTVNYFLACEEEIVINGELMKAQAAMIAKAPKMYRKLETVLALCEGNLLRKTRCDILGQEIRELLREARGEK